MGLFAVIGLPVLMPIVAVLQLLFPGLLGGRWRQYRVAVSVLLTQSAVIFAQWVTMRWARGSRAWWLRDDVLWAELVLTALFGVVAAGVGSWWSRRRSPVGGEGRPVRVEYLAFAALAAAGAGRVAYLLAVGAAPLDQMAVVAVAAVAGLLHLVGRQIRPAGVPGAVRTESVFLWGLVLAGSGIGLYRERPGGYSNAVAGAVVAEWPTFRGGVTRAGSLDPNDPGPKAPAVLWAFDPKERKGRVVFHSSPTVVDGQVYVGGLHEILTQAVGVLYCVNARPGRVAPGAALWRYTAENTLKPVYSSPTVVGGRVYVGEGYHQDRDCRLFCLDARRGDRALWTGATASHVESTPTVVGDRVYVGAGDDGLLALRSPSADGGPKVVWRVERLHVDASPLVTGDVVVVGSVAGDVYRDLAVIAVDARDGNRLWTTPTPLPVPGAPATAGGRVFVGLGNGKFNEDADRPAGALWCLDAATGRKLWEAKAGNGVLGSPALSGERVYFASRDHYCYAVMQEDGRPVWKADAGAGVVASPVVAGGRVYVLNVEGRLTCLDAADGTPRWRLDLDAPDSDAYSSPTLAGGRLYVAVGGKLLCVGDRESP